jgi:HSP20 family protein
MEKIMASIKKSNIEQHLEQAGQHFIHPFTNMQREVDKVLHGFYDLIDTNSFGIHEFENLKLSPRMDLVEDADNYKLEVEMPGLDEQDIRVSISGNILTIHGEKSLSRKDEKKNFIAREITYGSYERSITLPQNADSQRISASFKKGMLWVNIPKKIAGHGLEKQIKINKV